MTRTEKINLLAETDKDSFSSSLLRLTDKHCGDAAELISKNIDSAAFRLRLITIAAELIIAIELLAETIGSSDQINKAVIRIRSDRVEQLRLKLKKSTGYNIIQCDHCSCFRPIGIKPVEGTCFKSTDPNNRPLVSGDSFCQEIKPFCRIRKEA